MNKALARQVIDIFAESIPAEIGIDEISDEFDRDYDLVYDKAKEASQKYNLGHFEITNGATKVVVIFDNLDCVIKIPFTGMWYYQTDDDGEYMDNVDPEFEEFQGPSVYDCSDYCEVEYSITAAMKEAGFGEVVADIDYYKGICIQEKVEPFSYHKDNKLKPSKDSLERVKAMDRDYNFMDEDWTAILLDLYGEKYWRDLVDWDQGTDNYSIFADMYHGNYGYRFDGTPVMFDLSGFDECF